MSLEDKITKKHINFNNKINQDGGSEKMSLPLFLKEIKKNIESLIKKLNKNGKKLSQKSEKSIFDLLDFLEMREKQLQTIVDGMKKINSDDNYPKNSVGIKDLDDYSKNLKSQQMKGVDVINKLQNLLNSLNKKETVPL